MWDSSFNFQSNVGKRLRKLHKFASLKKVYYQYLQTIICGLKEELRGLENIQCLEKSLA